LVVGSIISNTMHFASIVFLAFPNFAVLLLLNWNPKMKAKFGLFLLPDPRAGEIMEFR
jgi:hypothetical protein